MKIEKRLGLPEDQAFFVGKTNVTQHLHSAKVREMIKDLEKFDEFARFDGLPSDVWGSRNVLLIAGAGLRTIEGLNIRLNQKTL